MKQAKKGSLTITKSADTKKKGKKWVQVRPNQSQSNLSPDVRLARAIGDHLSSLPPTEQIKKITAARDVLARARASRLATPTPPLSRPRTPLAALKHK